MALAAGAEAAGLTRAREATEEYVPGDLGLDLFRRDSRCAARGAWERGVDQWRFLGLSSVWRGRSSRLDSSRGAPSRFIFIFTFLNGFSKSCHIV